jgi:RES domain-containing protein
MDIADIAWVPMRGTWARHTAPGVDGLDAHSGGSRWLATGRPGLYLADSQETAWAEFYRFLAESRTGPARAMPRDLHRVTVDLDRVADLSTERARRVLALPRMRASQKQWPAFQAIGEHLIAERAQAVLFGSAARTRSRCLCVFEAGLAGLSVEAEPVRLITPPPPPRGLRT